MRLVRNEDIVPEPTSHDADLMKRVLVGPGVLPRIWQFSTITFPEGRTAEVHVHDEAYEVFYLRTGTMVFDVAGEEVRLEAGDSLVVEPGERHGVVDTPREAELIYFLLSTAGAS